MARSSVHGRPGDGQWQRHRILNFVQEFTRRERYSPSYREISGALGLSMSTVSYHVSRLQDEGLLHREPGRPRTITGPGCPAPADEDDKAVVPLIGQIAAGIPLDAQEAVEEIFTLPRWLVGHGQLFMLRVKGNSMTGAAIADGDLAVFRKQETAENGEIIAAMFDRDRVCEATVKTLHRLDGHTWLTPRNPAYPPIPADDAVILGKLTAVLRRAGR